MSVKVYYKVPGDVEIAPEGCYALILEEDEKTLLHFQSPNERVFICNWKDEQALKHALMKLVYLPLDYVGTAEVFSRIDALHQELFSLASSFQFMGEDLLANFLGTAPHAAKALDGMALRGKFQGVPACICGAGPSLEKKKDQLGGLIMAGGTALAALKKIGITPHFGAVIDPHPMQERMREAMGGDYPLFFRRHSNPAFLNGHRGALLGLPSNKGALFESGGLDGGHTSTTLLVRMALVMGCNPITLVGVDLAQTRDRTYACDLERSEGGMLMPIDGSDLFTRRDWLQSARWLEKVIRDNPQVEWINLSEGIRLEGTGSEAKKGGDVQVNLELPSWQKGIDESALEDSVSRVRRLSQRAVHALEKHFPKPPDTCGELAALILEIENEMAHDLFFDPIWQVWQHVFAREIPDGLPPGYGVDMHKWLAWAK